MTQKNSEAVLLFPLLYFERRNDFQNITKKIILLIDNRRNRSEMRLKFKFRLNCLPAARREFTLWRGFLRSFYYTYADFQFCLIFFPPLFDLTGASPAVYAVQYWRVALVY